VIHQIMKTQFRYQNLGIYRLLLAIMVAFSHFSQAGFGPKGLEDLVRPFQPGALGVYAFFVVSGYIITSAYDQFYTGRTKAFFINRFMRIYPPFLFAFLVSYAAHAGASLLGLAHFSDSVLALRTILRNLLSVFDPSVPAATENYYLFVRYVWAIVIELEFYVVAGIVFWTSFKTGRHAGMVLKAVTVVFVIAWLVSIQVWPWPPQLLGFGPLFLFGSVWYFFTRAPNPERPPNHWLAPFALITFAMAIAAFFLSMLSVTAPGAITSTICFALLIASFCRLTTTRPLELKQRKVDAVLGDLSYPVYLNHYVVELAFHYGVRAQSAGAVVLAMIATLLLSAVAAFAVERGTRRLRDRFRGQPLVR